MGCGGSKTATANTAPAAAPAAAQGDFKINLDNASGSKSLGAVAIFPENKYILVESVKEEGLISSWNQGCENTPEMQVKAGDLIVVINGVFGNSDLMMAELKSKEIILTVKRGQSATEESLSQIPEGAAKASVQADSPSQIPEGDFKINLENASGSESLGVVAKFPEAKYILVESVKEEGLIPSWNKGCENTPEMQVKAGDLIVVINGVFGNSDLMMAQLKSPSVQGILTLKEITLTVKRGPTDAAAPPAEVPSVDAAAAEAPSAENPVAEAPAPDAPGAEATAAEVALTETPAAGVPFVNAEPEGICGVAEVVSIEPEDAELGADAKEERFCKLAMC